MLKIGRTHLIDATPLALGQELGGMARQLRPFRRPRRPGLGSDSRVARRRHGGRQRNQYPSAVCPAGLRDPGQGDRHPLYRGGRSLRGQCPARRPGGMSRPDSHDRRHALHRGQQRPLAQLRPADRFPRNRPARPSAGQFDHAGQGQPGDVGEPDAGCGAGDWQRRGDRALRGRRQPVPIEHHDAGDGPRDPGEHPPAGRAPAWRSPAAAWSA